MNELGAHYARDGARIDLWTWGHLHRDEAYLRVGSTEVGPGPCWVSTVWLGMDHGYGEGPPVIFETMVFCEGPQHDHSEAQRRYCTEAEALEGHHEAVVLLLAEVGPQVVERR